MEHKEESASREILAESDPAGIISAFKRGIETNDKMVLLSAIMDLIRTFYVESGIKDAEMYKQGLEEEVELMKSGAEFARQGFERYNVDKIISAMSNGEECILGFFSGTAGERLIFNGKDKTIRYGGGAHDNKPLERFIRLFGGNTIHL